ALEPSFTGDDLEFAHRRSARHVPPGKRRRRLLGYLLVAVFALILGLGAGYARGYFASGAVGHKVTVVVPTGATLSSIASELEAKGVVKHARAFVIRAESDGYATKFMPGTYSFHLNEPYERLVALLARGVAPPTVKVSIPEGSTLRQAGGLVAAKVSSITTAGYVAVARDDPPPFRLGGYKAGTTLEGILFPATYDVLPKVKARAFVEQQLAAFEANFAKVDMTRALKANLTPYDVVIIASMIDREALVPAERPMVAAVIWNRLRIHMLLQIDATIQYALGKTKPVLTYDDLKIDSPYNTYKHAGLPPTPISNPGLAALQAAAAPANVDYLYYVARNDGTGRHYFSKEYAQFLVDQQKAKANGQ
ncbi:MAG TPA: endolytic transglycosylase MltG, partial [Thermoleophilia bacterium]